jgi:hypothetical protein
LFDGAGSGERKVFLGSFAFLSNVLSCSAEKMVALLQEQSWVLVEAAYGAARKHGCTELVGKIAHLRPQLKAMQWPF